jgi:hypothetical protein
MKYMLLPWLALGELKDEQKSLGDGAATRQLNVGGQMTRFHREHLWRWRKMVPTPGFELGTYRLQGGCSTN